jgi:hypothetical protein
MIKNLTFDNFHWDDIQLVFVQSKTRTTISLPLVKDIGWAVIDYLKYGRPKVDTDSFFVRHIAPFLPFSEGDHLRQMIIKNIWLAYIPITSKIIRNTLYNLINNRINNLY